MPKRQIILVDQDLNLQTQAGDTVVTNSDDKEIMRFREAPPLHLVFWQNMYHINIPPRYRVVRIDCIGCCPETDLAEKFPCLTHLTIDGQDHYKQQRLSIYGLESLRTLSVSGVRLKELHLWDLMILDTVTIEGQIQKIVFEGCDVRAVNFVGTNEEPSIQCRILFSKIHCLSTTWFEPTEVYRMHRSTLDAVLYDPKETKLKVWGYVPGDSSDELVVLPEYNAPSKRVAKVKFEEAGPSTAEP